MADTEKQLSTRKYDLKVYRLTEDLLEFCTEDIWIQGMGALNKEGIQVSPTQGTATHYSLVGMFRHLAGKHLLTVNLALAYIYHNGLLPEKYDKVSILSTSGTYKEVIDFLNKVKKYSKERVSERATPSKDN